jgi:hypothetical protein
MFIGLGVFGKSAKSFGFGIENRKDKYKTKGFG